MKVAQWAVFPNTWRNGYQAIPYILTGLRGSDGLAYANAVARTLKARGIPCAVQFTD